jgi:hypothetical protein
MVCQGGQNADRVMADIAPVHVHINHPEQPGSSLDVTSHSRGFAKARNFQVTSDSAEVRICADTWNAGHVSQPLRQYIHRCSSIVYAS